MMDTIGANKFETAAGIRPEALLEREPVQLDQTALKRFFRGKTVLVTGGGGSIGSELCRQLACCGPGQLIILDIYENNAYAIQQELLMRWGDRLDLRVVIASVRDEGRMEEVFRQYRPEIVFHAAAHKHVPLMEQCPGEAVRNNIFGTVHVMRAAERFGAEKFVMISTDKAVNPTSVMGATKRFCERLLQSRYESRTEFSAVRFGNILGSNGSVVPLFQHQIAAGGPVTITDRRIDRYFMTAFEAAQLVLEAGAMARQGQIFVLDMGDSVKILRLAEKLIRMSGKEPYRDIAIREIGLRPGEKLYEELLLSQGNLLQTGHARIFVEEAQHIEPEEIDRQLACLHETLARGVSDGALIALLRQMIPGYRAPEEVNGAAGERKEFLRSGRSSGMIAETGSSGVR